jgi:5-methylcytosine-specific restriction endonuclease McrA
MTSWGEREVEALAMSLQPEPPVLLKVPRETIRVVALVTPTSTAGSDSVDSGEQPEPVPAPPPRALHRITRPEFMELVTELRAALSHTHPGASLETLLTECVRHRLAAHAKATKAATDRPRPPKSPEESSTRAVPAAVRREVWRRDKTCTFIGAGGRRCGSTHKLELHHRIPFAAYGPSTVENHTLHCRSHNALESRRMYDPAPA